MDRKRTIVFVIIAIATLFLSFCHNSGKYEISNTNNFSDNPLWTYKSSEAISATPEIDDQRVFLRTLNSVIALDIQTGKIIWRATSQGDRPLSPSPKVFGNYLIVPEVASGIAVFDTNSGTLVWRIPGIDIAKSQHLTAHIRSITSADNELVYVVRFDWALTAYELKTGRVVWEQKFSDRALPYLSSNTDVVYLALGKTLRAFDAIQGDLIWEMSTDGYWGPIFVYKNILYAIDEARLSLQAINLKTQEIIWKEYYPAAKKYEARCLSVSNDLLYFTSQRLFAVSLDMTCLEKYTQVK